MNHAWKAGDAGLVHLRDFSQPLWLGEQSLQGKTILLYAEQGLGDTIQFCRYAILVARLGATVILEVQAPWCNSYKILRGRVWCSLKVMYCLPLTTRAPYCRCHWLLKLTYPPLRPYHRDCWVIRANPLDGKPS